MPGFTGPRWQSINAKLNQNPSRFGLPVRRDGSVIIGSFNSLKLGKDTNSAKRWDFLKRFVSRFDLLAVQEVMDDLSGIRRLHESLGSSFALLVSDTTGAFPGTQGLRERLAFFYRPSRIELKELVADITYDRSVVTTTLRQDINVWKKFFSDIDEENKSRKQEGKKPKSLSKFAHPAFLTFIRTPHCASLSIRGKNGADPVEFLALNAHTLFGKSKVERNREFFALLDWIIQRAKSSKRMYSKNMIVMADLNMQFDNADNKLSDIILRLHELESSLLTGQSAARANFPFLDVHPTQQALFRTNARRNETFDHIAFFVDRNEKGLPTTDANKTAGQNGPDGYDYGVFDFVELFAQAVHNTSFNLLSASKRTALLQHAEADVSDHMPIWARIPIPGA
jgi:hypothetical protein